MTIYTREEIREIVVAISEEFGDEEPIGKALLRITMVETDDLGATAFFKAFYTPIKDMGIDETVELLLYLERWLLIKAKERACKKET